MSKETSVELVEQKQVVFYDDQITAVLTKDNTVYVPVRPICELIGVDWNGQRRRINGNAVLSSEIVSVDVTSTQGVGPPHKILATTSIR